MITKQEVFDKVAKHLLTQNKKSSKHTALNIGSMFVCMYRGENGLKCAAGCLIPDDKYNDTIEGWRVGALMENKDNCFPIEYHEHVSLIKKLQGIHDDREVKDWKSALKSLAVECDLSTSVLE